MLEQSPNLYLTSNVFCVIADGHRNTYEQAESPVPALLRCLDVVVLEIVIFLQQRPIGKPVGCHGLYFSRYRISVIDRVAGYARSDNIADLLKDIFRAADFCA